MLGYRSGTRALALLSSAALLAGCAAAGPAGDRAPARAERGVPAAVRSGGKLVVSYERGTTAGDTRAQRFLEDHKVLQEVAAYANALIELAYDVPLKAATCEDGGPRWDPRTRSIIYCYGFVSRMRGLYAGRETQGPRALREKAVDQDVIGLTNGVLFHELAHALVDMYDLPITGREEDAADQLSVLLLAEGDEKHRTYAMSTVNAWAGLSETAGGDDEPGSYADEHSLDAQRFYNWACWLYGSDTRTYSYAVRTERNPGGPLPQDRAQRCPAEYRKIDHAWGTLLRPYLRKPAAG